MKHYLKPDGAIYAFEPDGSQDDLITDDMVPLNAEALAALRAPGPAPTPQVVSRFQARAALHLADLLTAVESLMADPATPVLSRLAWQDAQEFRRTSPTVLSMAAALELDDAALDALFVAAAGIEA